MGPGKFLVLLVVLAIAILASSAPGPGGNNLLEPQTQVSTPGPGANLRLQLDGTGPNLPTLAAPSFGLPPQSPNTAPLIDNRTWVPSTTSFPWSTIAKLLIYTDDPNRPAYLCSGVMISEFHVLTAGHCVYDQKDFPGPNHRPSRIKVIPAANVENSRSVEPYSYANATIMRTTNNWVRFGAYQEDLALLTLDQRIGKKTGWMDLKTDVYWSPMYRGHLFTAGYPGDGGGRQYNASGVGCRASEDNHWFSLDTRQGQSGSPVFARTGQRAYVLSIVAYGSLGCNFGTRLSEAKVHMLLDWMRADNGGISPIDYIDLMSQDPPAPDFSPKVIIPGLTRLTITHRVVNNGTVASGGFFVSYYASVDTTIDFQDFLLGTQWVDSLASSSSATVRWSGVVPSIVPGGKYWIGWILDSAGNVSEIDVGNNMAYIASSQATTSAASPLNIGSLSLGIAILVTTVPIALLMVVLVVSRRRPAGHPTWVPQQLPPPLLPGQPLWRYCAHCGNPFVPEMQFCANCGALLR